MRAVSHEPLTQPGPPPGIYASAYHTLTAILGKVVAARLALQHNNTAGAVDALTEAVALEDGLGYMEPPRCAMYPYRGVVGWGRGRAGGGEGRGRSS